METRESLGKTRRIQILPPHVVNRIAAGEVVERPASVVKELVENALDAGATRIEIIAGNGGRTLRIADNGCGMDRENAALAFHNHATSKITDDSDLARIDTLGFRGEALASISSISKLTCLTRTTEAASGLKITFDAEGNPVITETGCAPGTVMEVSELFYNTPARLKFLKRPQTEIGHIEETVENLALSHPGVQFSLTLNDKPALKTSGSGDLKITADEVFVFEKENVSLIPVAFSDEDAGYRLTGFVSSPGVTKSSKRWIVAYVNKRSVKCVVMGKAIERGFESLIEHGRYPVAILFLELPTDDVDVNVHPTKKEVRYASQNTIFSFVKQGVQQALEAHGFTAYTPPDPASFIQSDPKPYQGSYPSRPSFGGSTPSQPRLSYGTPEQTLNLYRPMAGTSSIEEISAAQQALDVKPASRVKVIGQLFNTYVLIETPQGLMVVDQHIASERTLFEKFSNALETQTPDTQQLMTAPAIALTPTQTELLKNAKDEFARFGFSYELSGNSVTLSGVPLIYAGREPKHLFETLLAQLDETGEMKLDCDHLLATLACHAAVRAGDVLTQPQMQSVIDQWLACTLPWTCPHGRPIAHTITTEELNRFFHRPSLPVNAGI